MHGRINSIENLIATDPGQRNVFALALPDQLWMSAQSLRLARRVGIVSGFFIHEAGAGETDGPPGAKVLGEALLRLGIEVDYITDQPNAPLFRALGIDPITESAHYLLDQRPTHLISIERVGRGRDGRYRNMRGQDITHSTEPLDQLFIDAAQLGLSTIGIGDGGNEIGMGKIFAEAEAAPFESDGCSGQLGLACACVIPTDFCIVAGVSNWGAFGLTGALSVLEGRDLLPSAESLVEDFERLVSQGGAVDGITFRRESTCDGQDLNSVVLMLERIRRQIAPSPIAKANLLVGIVGYGQTGRAAARLATQHGHRVRISDRKKIELEAGLIVDAVESEKHTVGFLASCDLIVASPGVRLDLPTLDGLRRRGMYIMSELELAFQLAEVSNDKRASCLIAVTGTVGKRSTVELLERLFDHADRPIRTGGNKGQPFSKLLCERADFDLIALAVSSFQLETVVHFRPHIAILLNIDAEHLDRHRSIAEYVRVKSRVFMNQKPDDILILPYDDPALRMLARKHQGRTFWISTKQPVDRGAWMTKGHLHLNVQGKVEDLGAIDVTHKENVLAAVLAARLYGIEYETLVRFLSSTSDGCGESQ